MTETGSRSETVHRARGGRSEDEISLFTLASVLLRHRGRIVRWALLWGALAVIPVLVTGPTWTARASFVPQASSNAAESGLTSLAGQIGLIALAGSTGSQSPEFYENLITLPVILGAVVADTITVAEEGGSRRAVIDLLGIRAPTVAWARDKGIRKLRDAVTTQVAAKTGVVAVEVRTRWPSVSVAVVERILSEVNRFNLQSRQSQAAEERRFVETRIVAQQRSLGNAEGRLGNFLQRNREYLNSPQLRFEYDHLERDVTLQQQVLVDLSRSVEEARIREVRDVPVVTVVESPRLPARPDPRGLAFRGLLGVLLGAFLGVVVALIGDMYARRQAEGDEEATRFAALVKEVWGGVARVLPRRRVPI